jgi:hypothetical protein
LRALLHYYGVLLLRSQRWLPPIMVYAALVAISMDGQSQLGSQFGWNAAMRCTVLSATMTGAFARPDWGFTVS